MNNNTTKNMAPVASESKTYSVFWPLTLALVSLIVLLSWNLFVTIRQNEGLQVAKYQVWQASAQSVQAEQKLKSMLSDLMDLAPQDAEAARIIKKYKITQNSPAAAAPKAR